jgi:hypothetical protein
MPDVLNDHDLLIELRTEMRGIRGDIKDMKDGTTRELAVLRKDVDSLKLWRGILLGMGILTSVAIIPLAVAVISAKI